MEAKCRRDKWCKTCRESSIMGSDEIRGATSLVVCGRNQNTAVTTKPETMKRFSRDHLNRVLNDFHTIGGYSNH
jgi:hypothetical protein